MMRFIIVFPCSPIIIRAMTPIALCEILYQSISIGFLNCLTHEASRRHQSSGVPRSHISRPSSADSIAPFLRRIEDSYDR
uniref:Secreted protein n=1 Tax=Raphanus sativus TaxID=3726 RepID=A0A650GAN3_RAPSA|nr:hypothetical protein [Raphanus sativus]QGW48514.1 hypothetical protein [Raphanus sativus]